MQSAAIKSERLVKWAAEPTWVGEKIKLQKHRSFNRLEMFRLPNGDTIHHRAWNGLAKAPTLEILQFQARKVGLIIPPFPAQNVVADIQKNIERLRAIDAEFHRPAIEFHCSEIERLSRLFSRS